jgi:hypothetical protein
LGLSKNPPRGEDHKDLELKIKATFFHITFTHITAAPYALTII